MKYEKSCGAVIFRKTRADAASAEGPRADLWNVLLIRHNKGRHVSFPKGHVEPGETESQTAEREIFAAVTDQAEITPQPEEIAEALWVPVDEADQRLTYERDRRIMHDAFDHIRAQSGRRHHQR